MTIMALALLYVLTGLAIGLFVKNVAERWYRSPNNHVFTSPRVRFLCYPINEGHRAQRGEDFYTNFDSVWDTFDIIFDGDSTLGIYALVIAHCFIWLPKFASNMLSAAVVLFLLWVTDKEALKRLQLSS